MNIPACGALLEMLTENRQANGAHISHVDGLLMTKTSADSNVNNIAKNVYPTSKVIIRSSPSETDCIITVVSKQEVIIAFIKT